MFAAVCKSYSFGFQVLLNLENFKFIFILFENKAARTETRDLPSAGSFPKYLEHEVKARSPKSPVWMAEA